MNDFSACFVCLVSFSFGGIVILAVFKGLGIYLSGHLCEWGLSRIILWDFNRISGRISRCILRRTTQLIE